MESGVGGSSFLLALKLISVSLMLGKTNSSAGSVVSDVTADFCGNKESVDWEHVSDVFETRGPVFVEDVLDVTCDAMGSAEGLDCGVEPDTVSSSVSSTEISPIWSSANVYVDMMFIGFRNTKVFWDLSDGRETLEETVDLVEVDVLEEVEPLTLFLLVERTGCMFFMAGCGDIGVRIKGGALARNIEDLRERVITPWWSDEL